VIKFDSQILSDLIRNRLEFHRNSVEFKGSGKLFFPIWIPVCRSGSKSVRVLLGSLEFLSFLDFLSFLSSLKLHAFSHHLFYRIWKLGFREFHNSSEFMKCGQVSIKNTEQLQKHYFSITKLKTKRKRILM